MIMTYVAETRADTATTIQLMKTVKMRNLQMITDRKIQDIGKLI